MKWMRLKIYLLPLILQEVDHVTEVFINLINDIGERKDSDSYTMYLDLRAEITKRIDQLEVYFDENIKDVRIAFIEKARIKLKKLLMYDPDVMFMMNNMDNSNLEGRNNHSNDYNDLYNKNNKEITINDIACDTPSSNIINSSPLTKPVIKPKILVKDTPSKDNLKQSLVKPNIANKADNSNKIPKQSSSDSKQNNVLKNKIYSSSHKKNNHGSVSPSNVSEFKTNIKMSQIPVDLISILANNNSSVISKDNSDLKEIWFKLKLSEDEYKYLMNEKANKVNL